LAGRVVLVEKPPELTLVPSEAEYPDILSLMLIVTAMPLGRSVVPVIVMLPPLAERDVGLTLIFILATSGETVILIVFEKTMND
jgi:hypothetical protein